MCIRDRAGEETRTGDSSARMAAGNRRAPSAQVPEGFDPLGRIEMREQVHGPTQVGTQGVFLSQVLLHQLFERHPGDLLPEL